MNIQKVSISQLKPNLKNPRTIDPAQLDKLVRSLKKFPEMMELRPIIVNKEWEPLGGNMRLKAAHIAGYKEVFIIHAEDLTEEQQKEFMIKDNLQAGKWNWSELSETWDEINLEDWGLELPEEPKEPRASEISGRKITITVGEEEYLDIKALLSYFKEKQIPYGKIILDALRSEAKDEW